jgi:hypothetical protein
MTALRAFLEKRPTEALTGLGLAASIYGFLTQAGVSQQVAAIIAVAIAFAPAAVSEIVDRVRRPFAEPHVDLRSDDVDRYLRDRTSPPPPTDPGKPTRWGPGA